MSPGATRPQSHKSTLAEVPNLREGAVLASPVTRIIACSMLWSKGDRGGEERENCLNHAAVGPRIEGGEPQARSFTHRKSDDSSCLGKGAKHLESGATNRYDHCQMSPGRRVDHPPLPGSPGRFPHVVPQRHGSKKHHHPRTKALYKLVDYSLSLFTGCSCFHLTRGISPHVV